MALRLLFVVLCAGLLGTATARADDEWAVTGPLSTPRSGGTLTVAGGKGVLVGGRPSLSGALVRKVEAFEPRSRTWVARAPLAVGRADQAAVALADGRLLVAGGTSSLAVPSATTEIFDPRSNAWAPAAPMSRARAGASATLLADGRVLVAGGWQAGATEEETLPADAELYDPGSNSWSPAGAMQRARFGHGAVRLPDGSVLVVGGHGRNGTDAARANQQTTAERYDPATNAWAPAGALGVHRLWNSVSALPSGEVLVAGGEDATGESLASTWRYDPGTAAWRPAAPMPEPRSKHGDVVLPAGGVLVAGGIRASNTLGVGGELVSAAVYNPTTNVWTSAPAPPRGEVRPQAVLLPDGTAVFAGGSAFGADRAAINGLTFGVPQPQRGASSALSPVRGRTVVLVPLSGTIKTARGRVAGATAVAVGKPVDSRRGTVRVLARTGGADATVTLAGGRFSITQRRAGSAVADVRLLDRPACRDATRTRPTLRARGGPAFRVRTTRALTIARGTARWRVQERCAGTYVTALSGRVSVRDLRSGDAVTLRAGASRLVPARR